MNYNHTNIDVQAMLGRC